MERIIALPQASPREQGQYHGERYAGEIRSLATLRTYLCTQIGNMNTDEVFALAKLHLPVLQEFDQDLYGELLGIAEGANVPPEHVVVINHYTDLRDIDPAILHSPAGPSRVSNGLHEEGCSVVYIADSSDGPLLAQTWDMHATALPYVGWVSVPRMGEAPAAMLLSLTGCLGMAGINEHGVAIAINNLSSTDARIGVVWPAMVRKALRTKSAKEALAVFENARLGSGHHYIAIDLADALALETSGVKKQISLHERRPWYVHTNHCLTPEVAQASRIPSGSTTLDRFGFLESSLRKQPPKNAYETWRLLGSHEGYPRSVCTDMATPEKPHLMATCAALVMMPRTKTLLGRAGFTHNTEPSQLWHSGK